MRAGVKNSMEHLTKIRKAILDELERTTFEEKFLIPTGCNNNILWQVGHILATQQIFHYKLSGKTPRVDFQLIEKYQKGTRPTSTIPDIEELDLIKMHLVDRVHDLIADYTTDRLTSFTEYTTGFGVKISSIEEALAFNNIHEALHLGRMATMRQILHQKNPLPFS